MAEFSFVHQDLSRRSRPLGGNILVSIVPLYLPLAVRSHQPVGRASDCPAATVEYMGVDHCRADVPVSQKFLDCPDVVAIFEQVGCKRMPQRVADGWLNNLREEGSFLA